MHKLWHFTNLSYIFSNRHTDTVRDENTPLTKYKKVEILKTWMLNINNVLNEPYLLSSVSEKDCHSNEVSGDCKAPTCKVVTTASVISSPTFQHLSNGLWSPCSGVHEKVSFYTVARWCKNSTVLTWTEVQRVPQRNGIS